MNGYEFTRSEADFTSKVKAQAYEISIVAMQAKHYYEINCQDYREDADYIDAKEWFIDSTLSCNEEEVIHWMEYFMANAIAYGIQTRKPDWKTKFLAAYDLFNDFFKK